jgi:hypothetical protein
MDAWKKHNMAEWAFLPISLPTASQRGPIAFGLDR